MNKSRWNGRLLLVLMVSGCGSEGQDVESSRSEISLAAISPTSVYQIKSAATGKCIGVAGNSKSNNANIEERACNGSVGQNFTIASVATGYYAIKNTNSAKCLDVTGKSTSDGVDIIQYTCTSSATNQQWAIADTSGGAVRLTAHHSGKVAGLNKGATADGTLVVQETWNGATYQQFKLSTGTGGAGGSGGSGGSSGTCTAGASCQPANPCQIGTISCSTGSPVCVVAGNKAAGVLCGAPASCNPSTNMATPAQVCDGSGNCPAAPPVMCPSGCNGVVCASAKPQGAACTSSPECVTGNCTDGVCCNVASCGTCMACNLNGAGTCSAKAANASDSACPASTANCMAGGCNGYGNCTALAAGTSCGSDVCTNGPEDPLILGQYTASTYQRRLCDGGSGASHCVLGANQGCVNNLTCASATACRASCTRDADCVASYLGGAFYCNGGTCALRKGTGVACTTHNQCLSRVCAQGTCAECTGDDDCPNTRPSCCGGSCKAAGVCDDYASNSDGSVMCNYAGVCGSRHSVCTGTNCGCGSVVDCPIGTVCNPSNQKCLVNGGQPCVQSSDCLSNNCGTDGLCTLSLPGSICSADTYSTGRPTGCSSASLHCDDKATQILNSICY
jgi:hypothetical protein